jgi:hypothetical protein
MSRFVFAAMTILLLAALPLGAVAQFGGGHRPHRASSQKETFSFTGRVASVDYASNVVEVTTGGRHVTVVIEPTTAIDFAGEPGSVSDIRPGIKIHAEGVVRDGTFIAQTITIHAGAKSKIQDSQ